MKNSLIALGLLWPFFSWSASLTLSFDDAPTKDKFLSGTTRTNKLIKALKESGVEEVVFYCNPKKNDQKVKDRLAAYNDAGHSLANHTNTHPKLSNVSAEEYIKDIQAAEEALRPYRNYRQWFRYPYLDEGADDQMKHKKVKDFLASSGYKSGYATIEIFDWHIDGKLHDAVKAAKKIDFEKLKAVYIRIFLESIDFYEQLALKTIGYTPIHVVLLHENDLNALFMTDIVRALNEKKHTVLRAREAMTDPIANNEGWNSSPMSMRRISLIAQEHGLKEIFPPYISTRAIDVLLEEAKVFQ